jgi:membrane protease YdiL (CAAX protease family)
VTQESAFEDWDDRAFGPADEDAVPAPHTGAYVRFPWWPLAMALLLGLAINVLNNELAPKFFILTSVAGTWLLILIAHRADLHDHELGIAPGWMTRGIKFGGGLTLLILLVYIIAAAIPATRTLFQDSRHEGLTLGAVLWMAFVKIPFGTVLFEETLFRGVLYGMGLRRWGPTGALLFSSLFFGFWHVLPSTGISHSNAALENIVGSGVFGQVVVVIGAVLFTSIAGAVFVLLRRFSRSLLTPMIMHWATNGLGILFSYFVLNTLLK